MIQFTAVIQKFAKQGEKTGWSYIHIPIQKAQLIKPGNKKIFRVKGTLDSYAIKQVALLPMGEGDFIMPLNVAMRKGIHKRTGEKIVVRLEEDTNPIRPPKELIACLKDEPEALKFFNSLAKSHQNYFTKWIESAKTDPTKAKRIAQTINALLRKQHFGQLLRSLKNDRKELYE